MRNLNAHITTKCGFTESTEVVCDIDPVLHGAGKLTSR